VFPDLHHRDCVELAILKKQTAAIFLKLWAVHIATTLMIAAGAAGNVRAAMADLEMWMG
jgi:hypothetical protein